MAVALAFSAQDGVLLRKELKAGGKDAYQFSFKTTQQMNMEGGPAGAPQQVPIEVTASMKMTTSYGVVDEKEKKADLTVDMTEIAVDLGAMAGMMPGQEFPKEMKITGKIDTRNRVSQLKMPKTGAAGMMMMGGGMPNMSLGPMFVEFPEAPVKTGDTWKMTIAGNALTKKKDIVLDATLLGEKDFNGEKVYAISVKGIVALDGDMAEVVKDNPEMAGPMGDMKVLIKGTIDMSGEALVAKKTGRTLKMDLAMVSKQDMDFPEMGMKMNAAGNSTMKIVLIPPKP